MTLLESVVAFVLLSVVGIACLDLSRGATGLETRSAQWTHAVAVGDAAMAAAAASAASDAMTNDGAMADDAFRRDVQVQRTPWRDGADGLDVIDVRVTLPTGERYHAMRLVRSFRSAPVRSASISLSVSR